MHPASGQRRLSKRKERAMGGQPMRPEERVQALLKAPPDGWVAFSGDESRVVGYGKTYDEAVAEADKAGDPDAILVKVPIDWTELVLALT